MRYEHLPGPSLSNEPERSVRSVCEGPLDDAAGGGVPDELPSPNGLGMESCGTATLDAAVPLGKVACERGTCGPERCCASAASSGFVSATA